MSNITSDQTMAKLGISKMAAEIEMYSFHFSGNCPDSHKRLHLPCIKSKLNSTGKMYSWSNFGYMKGNSNPLGYVRRIGCLIGPIEPNELPLIRYSWHFSTSFSKLNLISCEICRLKLLYCMLYSNTQKRANLVCMLKFNIYTTPLYGSRDQVQSWTPYRACTPVAVWVHIKHKC